MSFGIDDPRDEQMNEVYVLANTQDKVIRFLFKELWDLVTDGDEPDFNQIEEKLKSVDIDINDLMV